MNIKDKKTSDMREEAENVILPEGYDGGDLFDETGRQEKDPVNQSAENGQEQGETEKNVADKTAQTSKTEQQEHGFRGEVAALLEQYPTLREKLAKGEGLPGEVLSDCLKNGSGLCAAYAEYEAKRAKAEAEQMRRENEILRQNSAAAAKAPVKGTAAGCSVKTEGRDPFLEGLLSDE